MKKNYEELELKVITFTSEDIITASGEECTKVLCRDLVIPCNVQCMVECRVVECTDMICKRLGCMDMCEM